MPAARRTRPGEQGRQWREDHCRSVVVFHCDRNLVNYRNHVDYIDYIDHINAVLHIHDIHDHHCAACWRRTFNVVAPAAAIVATRFGCCATPPAACHTADLCRSRAQTLIERD